MLSWITQKEPSNPYKVAAPVMKRPAPVNDELEWRSPAESLAAIEVKELSVAEFMAVYKPQLNRG